MRRGAGILAGLLTIATPAQGCGVALVLLMDVSASVRDAEWQMQRDAHAAAFRHPALQAALRDGAAVAALQFDSVVRPALRWRVVGPEGAAQLADEIAAMPRLGQGGTSTGHALLAALALLDQAPQCDREVIDLVTDGPGDDRDAIARARDAAALRGVRINALGVRTSVMEHPADWLRQHVVTPGGFALEVESWGDVADALRRKLVMEVGAR